MVAYINLRNYVKDIIKSHITNITFHSDSAIRFLVDSYIAAANSENLEFKPSRIKDNHLIISCMKDGELKTIDIDLAEIKGDNQWK